jgi:hypothetical protein
MGGGGGSPVVQPVPEAPQVVDTSSKVAEEERGRKTRKGIASQIVSGESLSGINVNKKTLGA